MARLIQTDGTITEVHPKGKKWTLRELQSQIGGYIQFMPGIKSRMIVDEDGQIKGLPINHPATSIVTLELEGKALRYHPVLVGPVLIFDKGEKF